MKKKDYSSHVTKYAKKANNNFKRLCSFCKRNDISSTEMDKLCVIIDAYSKMNCDILKLCIKDDIDYDEFACKLMDEVKS